MKKPFNEATYLAQVRRLRNLAALALAQYPIQVKDIHFVNHGENTTFRIQSRRGLQYLLRIHRDNYHTKAAIEEEISWLNSLSKAGLSVPKPVISKNHEFVETVSNSDFQNSRYCSLFHWIEGRFIDKSISPKHLFQVGALLAELQKRSPRFSVAHRRYWTSKGLMGSKPKFGSIDLLDGVSTKQQKIISQARKFVFAKLQQFEKKFPERQGLIHADLHFGNILTVGENLGAIDFDDCGFGFHAYDLVIPLISAQGILGEKGQNLLPEFKDALISGYLTGQSWDHNDEKIFPYLIAARRLTMLGWLNSRADNPKLRKHFKGSVERVVNYLKRENLG